MYVQYHEVNISSMYLNKIFICHYFSLFNHEIPELNIVTAGVTNATIFYYYSLATKFFCFSLKYFSLLVATSENLGASWLQGFLLKVEPCIHVIAHKLVHRHAT